MYSNAKYISACGTVDTILCDINGVSWCIPMDTKNVHYQNIMALVEKGQLTIAPAEEQK